MPTATTLPAPPEDTEESCSMCGKPARFELRHDAFACSVECCRAWSEQFCPSCGCNEAEGELHSQVCADDYRAEFLAELHADDAEVA